MMARHSIVTEDAGVAFARSERDNLVRNHNLARFVRRLEGGNHLRQFVLASFDDFQCYCCHFCSLYMKAAFRYMIANIR